MPSKPSGEATETFCLKLEGIRTFTFTSIKERLRVRSMLVTGTNHVVPTHQSTCMSGLYSVDEENCVIVVFVPCSVMIKSGILDCGSHRSLRPCLSSFASAYRAVKFEEY